MEPIRNIAQDAPEPAKEDNWLTKTVRLSGLSFLIGDIAIVGGGVYRALRKGGNRDELGNALTGLIWAQAGVASGLYGNPKKPMQLRIHAHNLEDYLANQGIAIPSDLKQQTPLLEDRGNGERIERFISKHPTEVFNSIIGAASLGMVYSGGKALIAKDKTKVTKGAVNSLWAGLLVMAGAASGLFIKEDPKAREKAKDGNAVDKTVAFVREQPLRLTSTFYLLNDVFIFRKAWDEYGLFNNGGKKDWGFVLPTTAAVTNLIGNFLLFASRRNQLKKGYSAEQVGQFEDLGAAIVLSQPVANRQHVAESVARYMCDVHISERPVTQLRDEILMRAQARTGLMQPTLQPVANFAERVRQSQDAALQAGPAV